jgi:predicted ATPase
MISSLKLKNIKSFKKADIPFGSLTVLSGLNSSGKSTVLQSIGLLRQSYQAGFLAETGWLLNGDFVNLGVGSDLLHEDNEVPELGIGFVENDLLSSWEVAYAKDGDVLNLLPTSGPIQGDSAVFSESFQFLRADRVNPQPVYAKSRHAVSRSKFLGTQGQYTAHYLSFYSDDLVNERLRGAVDRGLTPGLLSHVNAWMQEFSPGVRLEVHEVSGTDLVRLSYAFGSGVSESIAYRPTNVGFGLTYSLPIVVACLSTASGGLLLLENPEAHLHPKGQMAMGRLISLAASSGVQVIVETHSDHLLNGVRLAAKRGEICASDVQLHFFTRDSSRRQSAFDSPVLQADGRLSFWPDGFFDQWDKALLELVD